MDLTPAYQVTADDEDVTAAIRAALVELRVESTADRQSDSVEIVLGDEGGTVAAPPTGRLLRVRIGYRESGLVDAGAYWHSETELEWAPRRLTVRGVAADIRAASALKTPRTRSWHDTTVAALVEAVAAEHGLDARVAGQYAAAAVPHLDQTESDLHLLRRLAAQHDATVALSGSRIAFGPAAAATTAAGSAQPTVAVDRAHPPSSLRVSYRERPRVGAVRALWPNIPAARPAHETAGSGEPVMDLPDPYPSRAEAAAAAAATLRQHTRAVAQLELDLPGQPALFAGGIVTVEWDQLADGRWSVTRATHTIRDGGYTTSISATPASG